MEVPTPEVAIIEVSMEATAPANVQVAKTQAVKAQVAEEVPNLMEAFQGVAVALRIPDEVGATQV